MASSKVWLITGCSSGLGRVLAECVVARGDRLIATARKPETLATLVALDPERVRAVRLDVTKPDEARAAVQAAMDAFGRLDVLVNNAGYGLVGALEEISDAQMQANMATNFLGPIHMMRAVLPLMRLQRAGHILNIGAIAGISNEVGFSIYGGSKFGIEGVSEAVAGEVAPLGIKVTIIEPGPFRTDFISRSLERGAEPIADYAPTSGRFSRMLDTINGKQVGDPVKAANAMIAVVEAEKPPLRLPLGKYAYDKLRKKLASVSAEVDAWESVGRPTDFSS